MTRNKRLRSEFVETDVSEDKEIIGALAFAMMLNKATRESDDLEYEDVIFNSMIEDYVDGGQYVCSWQLEQLQNYLDLFDYNPAFVLLPSPRPVSSNLRAQQIKERPKMLADAAAELRAM